MTQGSQQTGGTNPARRQRCTGTATATRSPREQAQAILAQGQLLAAAAAERTTAIEEKMNRYQNPNFPGSFCSIGAFGGEEHSISLERIEETLNQHTELLTEISEAIRRLSSALLCAQNLR